MRGVIALAAAMSLPAVDNAGAVFPQRESLDLSHLLRHPGKPWWGKGSLCHLSSLLCESAQSAPE